jgi:trehalose 6-phosphate synthase
LARLVIVSNRVSLPRERLSRAGGLAVAVREALQREHGLWFGWSGEVAAEPAAEARIATSGKVTYAVLDLSPEDHDAYYVGYANSTLWPLFHYRLGLIDFRRQNYPGYRKVNAAFARALKPLLGPDDLIWVHDYHFIPFAAELRRLGVGNRIGFFLHIPFPVAEVLTALPDHRAVVEALCDYDLIGFQIDSYVRAFADYVVNEEGGGLAEDGTVSAFGRAPRVAAFPIGIETDEFAAIAEAAASAPESLRLKQSLAGRALIIGVDRLDYSKGLVQRIEAYQEFLSRWPEHRSKVTFMQIAPVSRGEVAQYRALRRELEAKAGRVNGKFAEFDWMPVRYLNKSFPRATLAGFYRMSRIGLVTPLRDGMNLVAKEYVAAQDAADPGVLVLSRFAGAARELAEALVVNPYDVDQVAEALHRGLSMPLDERRARWRTMMAALGRNTVDDWRERFLARLRDCPPRPA